MNTSPDTTQQTSVSPQPVAVPSLAEIFPVRVEFDYPEHSSRLWAAATLVFFIPKVLALIPHMIILYILSYIALLLGLIGQVAVLFTGRYPRSLFNFVTGFIRWQTRANSFMFGLTDKYPPFSLE